MRQDYRCRVSDMTREALERWSDERKDDGAATR